ncbi:MAG TPA: hypothetical protein VFC56_20630 [Stellaceae bacterium]|nr:hypothetical protein [Stellaceae bacterium]
MAEFFPTDAEMMARTFGIVLGAASCNGEVTNERLDVAAEKMKTVLAATAGDARDAEAACERFSAAVVAGRRASKSGEIEDWAAETALRQIEDDLDDTGVVQL